MILLRARQRIGKYRILGRIASGPLADVYRAYDTIQDIKVALKIPKQDDQTGHDDATIKAWRRRLCTADDPREVRRGLRAALIDTNPLQLESEAAA